MPRNVFTPLFDVPINVPLSRVTMGGVAYVVGLGAARTMAVAVQRVKSFARRKVMSTRGKGWQTLRETYEHYEGI
jgi:hypothetical protein